MALQHGITLVVKQGLMEKYGSELNHVCESKQLDHLSLDLKGVQLSGEVPEVLLRICAKADFFDLSGNNFDIAEGSYMQHIVEHLNNMRDFRRVDLRNQPDILGEHRAECALPC